MCSSDLTGHAAGSALRQRRAGSRGPPSAGFAVLAVLRGATSKIPIVFFLGVNHVEIGLVASFNSPGGNVTGFMQFEYSLSAKWLELLKEIAPTVTRAAVLRDPTISAGIGQFAVIQAVAPATAGWRTPSAGVNVAADVNPAHPTSIRPRSRPSRPGSARSPDAVMTATRLNRRQFVAAAMRDECTRLASEIAILRDIYDEHTGLQDRVRACGIVTPALAAPFSSSP